MAVLQDVYPSRQDSKPGILERLDDVVYTEKGKCKSLSPEQAASFDKNGFLVVSSLFNEKEVDAFRAELRKMVSRDEIRNAGESITEPGSGDVRSIFSVHRLSGLFAKLSADPRILGIVKDIVGEDVYIHQSRINLKPGFAGKEFYWHSDFETWHVEDGMPRMRAVSVSIALTENNDFNGPLMLVPGSHRSFVACVGETPEDHYKHSLKKQEYGVPDNESLSHLVEQGGIVSAKGPAGSVTFFDCNVMHGSNSNISPYPRSNVFFVYNGVSNRLVEPFGAPKPRPEFIAAREHVDILTPSR